MVKDLEEIPSEKLIENQKGIIFPNICPLLAPYFKIIEVRHFDVNII